MKKISTSKIHGLKRIIIESVKPKADGGRLPIKHILRDEDWFRADLFSDRHDHVIALLRFNHAGERMGYEMDMTPLSNDSWEASFSVTTLGDDDYTIAAWADPLITCREIIRKRLEADQVPDNELAIDIQLIKSVSRGDFGALKAHFHQWGCRLSSGNKTRGIVLSSALLATTLSSYDSIDGPAFELDSTPAHYYLVKDRPS